MFPFSVVRRGDRHGHACRWLWLLGVLTGLACSASNIRAQGDHPATNSPARYPLPPTLTQESYPQTGYPAMTTNVPFGSSRAIEPTAYANKKKPTKRLPYHIIKMPQAEEELE